MSERPIGDELDQRIRSVVAEIVEPAMAPESLEDLLVPRVKQGDVVMLEKNPKRKLPAPWLAIAAVVVIVVAVVGAVLAFGSDDEPIETFDDESGVVEPGPDDATEGAAPALELSQPDGVPDALYAAEAWMAQPTGGNLLALFDAVGGIDALTIGDFTGSYDVVTFDPGDPSRILASFRDPFSDSGENQDENTLYVVDGGDVTSELYAPDTPHDSANFERDGSIVVWETARASRPSPRNATIVGADGEIQEHRRGVFNGRWAADGGSLFTIAPTSAAAESPYTNLEIQPVDGSRVELDVDDAVWVNSPEPGVFGAYSEGGSGARLFDSADGAPLTDHPLAGLSITRAVVSQDGTRAITTAADGTIEVLDMESGEVVATLGQIDTGEVRDPIQLNADGSVALAVDQSGVVRMWHVDDGDLIFQVEGFSAPHRSLTDMNSTTKTSVVDAQGRRVALFTFVDDATWTVVDTDVDSWVDRACALAGRSLTEDEQASAGIPADRTLAC